MSTFNHLVHVIMTESNTFRVGEVLSYGWERFREQGWILAGSAATIIILSLLFSLLSEQIDDTRAVLIITVSLVSWLIQMYVSLGLYSMTLKVSRRGKAFYSDLFSQNKLLLKYIGASIVSSIIVVIGFFLLIVPGIILSIMFIFYPYVLVDQKSGVFDSLKKSAEITKGNRWKLLWLMIVLSFFNVLGFLMLFIGLAISIPFSLITLAYVYDRLLEGLTPATAEDHHPSVRMSVESVGPTTTTNETSQNESHDKTQHTDEKEQ